MSYTPNSSAKRAQKLQDLCRNLNLNALIFILGLDSKRNRLDEKAFFWLFQGFSGQNKLNSVSVPFKYEEVAWIVTPNSFEIFVGSACNELADTESAFTEIQKISCSWNGGNATTVTKDEVSDSEAAEETKILWFIRCMKKILGPVGICSDQIETWPLIQAYAIDMFGCGFFSNSHPHVNISEMLEPYFCDFDETAVDILVTEHLPRLKTTFDQTIEFVNKRGYPQKRGDVKEEDIKDCICLPYEYVMISNPKEVVHKPKLKLWGKFDDGKALVKNATHMNVQGVCGISGLMVSRSWFFIPQGTAKSYLENKVENDMVGVMELYKVLVGITKKTLHHICDHSVQEFIDLFLFELYKDHLFLAYHNMLSAVREGIQINLNSYDADGVCHDFSPNQYPLHSIQILIFNIKSENFEDLGGLSFGESFLIKDGKIKNLTENIEPFIMWESTAKKQMQSEFGQRLSTFENVKLYVENWCPFDGALIVYESGWGFKSVHLGDLEYEISSFKKIEQHSSDLVSFFSENARYVFKVSARASGFLMSVWNIEAVSTEGPEYLYVRGLQKEEETVKVEAETNEKTKLYIVIGMPGSGKTRAAEDIAKAIKAEFIKPSFKESVYLNKEFWRKSFEDIKSQEIVAALPGFMMPADILDLIPPHVELKSVIVKIFNNTFYMNKRKEFLPRFLPQIHVSNSLIYEEKDSNNDIIKFITAPNPSLEVFWSKGSISPQQARTILSSATSIRPQYSYKPLYQLQTLFINCPLPLLESKIRQKLLNAHTADEGNLSNRLQWENNMQILYVKGSVFLKGKTENQAMYDVRGNTKEVFFKEGKSEEPGLLFIGRNLEKEKLIEMVLECRAYTSKLPLKTRQLLESEEIKRVEDTLGQSEDYFFDGTYYMDAEGKRSLHHPDLEDKLEEYIDEENERIGKFNRSLEKENSIIRKANQEEIIKEVFA
ncbi:unnamed protein product [Blepharisma stoltei]|uniref:DAAF9 N-terminal domain-containing protein n=1 Tax=Blepharisma stoltei TaxID=1481888 RepID=A0AAU9KEW1_9CILI|nr:unnamed protein product [Blepharisma stoltei]